MAISQKGKGGNGLVAFESSFQDLFLVPGLAYNVLHCVLFVANLAPPGTVVEILANLE